MAQTVLHPSYLEAAFILNVWVSSDVKSARHYFIITIYKPKVVYDMVINTFLKNTSNDKFCSRRVDTRGKSIYVSIGGTVDGKLERNKFLTSSNFSELRERQAYFTMHTSIPILDRRNVLLDQNYISRQNQNQAVGDGSQK